MTGFQSNRNAQCCWNQNQSKVRYGQFKMVVNRAKFARYRALYNTNYALGEAVTLTLTQAASAPYRES